MKAICITILVLIIGTFGFIFISGTMSNEMKYMKNEIAELQNQLMEKDAEISSLEQQIAEKDLANSFLKEEQMGLNAEISSIQAELDFTRSQLDLALISNAEYEAKTAELTTSLNIAQASLWEKDVVYQECVSQTRIIEIQLDNERKSVSYLQAELAEVSENAEEKFSLMGLDQNILIILSIGIASLSMGLPVYKYIRENNQPSEVWVKSSPPEEKRTCWDDKRYREFRREKARGMERRSRENQK